MSRKVGRPKKVVENEHLRKTRILKMSDHEWELTKEMAEECDMNVSDFIRFVVLGNGISIIGWKKRRRKPIMPDEIVKSPVNILQGLIVQEQVPEEEDVVEVTEEYLDAEEIRIRAIEAKRKELEKTVDKSIPSLDREYNL